jgi:hypothetical protein
MIWVSLLGRAVPVWLVFVASPSSVVTAQVVTIQTVAPKTGKAQRFKVLGRVVDDSEDAVQGVLIRVEAAQSDGPLPAQRFPTLTDDHDEFSLSLGRGKYYIVASPIGGIDNRSEIHIDGSSGDPYGPTYYPSTVNRAAAVHVAVVGASSNTALLVIRLLREPAGPVAASTPAAQKSASVEGMVINQLTGAPLARVHVSLWNSDDGVHRDYGAMTNLDGTFSVTGMPPVTYGIGINRAGFANRACCTSVALRAGEHMRGLKLPLVPSAAISGRVLSPTASRQRI